MPTSKEVSPLIFETKESFFGGGTKGFATTFLFVGFYFIFLYNHPEYGSEAFLIFSVILISFSSVILWLKAIYKIDIRRRVATNYFRLFGIQFPRGKAHPIEKYKAILCKKENKMVASKGISRGGAFNSVTMFSKVPSNYKVYLVTAKTTDYVSEYPTEKEAALALERIQGQLNLVIFWNRISRTSKLDNEYLSKGKIRLRNA